MFTRLGTWCVRRRGVVVLAWIAALFLLGGVVGAVGSDVRTDFDLPDVESRAGFEVLEDRFEGFGAGAPGQIVFQNDEAFADPAVVAAVQDYLAEVDAIEGTTVIGPFSPPAQDPAAALAAMSDFLGDDLDPETLAGPSQVSADGTIAYASVELPGETDQESAAEFAE